MVVTLELSEAAAHRAAETARQTGRRVDEILTAWIERGAMGDPMADAGTGTGYALLTPYGNETAARTLLEALHDAEASDATQSCAVRRTSRDARVPRLIARTVYARSR